jgi:hypothetical protein
MEKTRRAIDESVAPIRFESQNLRFVFFFHARELLCYRKDLNRPIEADEREADEVLDLLIQEPAGFA